jgi:hypothetical protein
MHTSKRFGVALVALALLAFGAAGCGDDESATTTEAVATTEASTTTQAATTTAAPTTSFAGAKVPAAGIGDVVERLYAALNDMDNEAFRALVTDTGEHSFYYVNLAGGSITYTGAQIDIDLPTSGYRSIEVLGEPIVSGNALAVPVAYDYPEGLLTGFDLLVLAPTGDGWLVAGGATFIAVRGLEADQAALPAINEADVAAWNEGDAAGVLALYRADAMFWEQVTDVATAYTGTALEEWVAGNLYFDVEITGDPVYSGPFAVVPNRLVLGAESSEGISLYWIQDGLIALHAFGQ